MVNLNKNSIIYERMRRQRLLEPIGTIQNVEEYLELFKLMQPVAPVHFTRPGDPPKLVHRTDFDDYDLSNQLREKHRIIKGRFAGGRVGYVEQQDLEQYATAFRKNLTKVKPIHEDILSMIRNSGGVSKDMLKEELEYPSGEITKALNSLQEAFLVYEDQTDTDWDTGWFDFFTEWFELKNDAEHTIHNVSLVLLNYLKSMVFGTLQQIKDWSEINIKTLKQAIKKLENDGDIKLIHIDGLGEGYIRTIDLHEYEHSEHLQSVFMLDKSDMLVRSNMTYLKQLYKGHEVLQYLLIDGEFMGAVLGHWRIGPYDIDDILVEMEPEELEERKEEIIKAVRKIYSPERTRILKFKGEDLKDIKI